MVISAIPAVAAEGVNFRVTEHPACALTLLPVEQVEEEIEKSAAPVRDGLAVNMSGPLPMFVSVTVMVGLGAVPTAT